ncbi:OsmC family protein [Paenibacillus sp. PK3_47]|uniref:OsmC family protein n=1 Tax=Paenibacillus sp. PK3_47 TaxID=2072642 RepID=UPI00201DA597|nr:OsmC family protein [Paenibacillus sp. PK3_47]
MDRSKTILNMEWNGNKSGNGTIEAEYLKTEIAVPQSFGGTGEGSEPKELLVASAATCFLMTLVGMLEARSLIVESLKMRSEASVSKEEGFKITHYPAIKLPVGATEEQIQSVDRTLAAADRNCDIGNLLKKAGVQIDISGDVSIKL